MGRGFITIIRPPPRPPASLSFCSILSGIETVSSINIQPERARGGRRIMVMNPLLFPSPLPSPLPKCTSYLYLLATLPPPLPPPPAPPPNSCYLAARANKFSHSSAGWIDGSIRRPLLPPLPPALVRIE